MVLQIGKKTEGKGLLYAVEEISGVSLKACLQCKKCSGGCPVASYTTTPPAEVVRRLQLGGGDELLTSDIIWMCLSCETCYARCPMGINLSAVMDALRKLTGEKAVAAPAGGMPLFNGLFLDQVKKYGRSYDLGTILSYKLKTRHLSQDTEKLPAMLGKHKIAILPPKGGDKAKVKKIFNAVSKSGEAGK